MKNELTHTDKAGKAHMVDVSGKHTQLREAWAEGSILLRSETIELIRKNEMKKGDVLSVAQIAGITGAKKTSDLIPLCHPLPLTKIDVSVELKKNKALVKAYAKSVGQTGVEMEALTAVSISLLTLYDMCKAVDKYMVIEQVRLVKKQKQVIGNE